MRGTFVVVVGPDGVGKTTFARELMSALGPTSRYFHFRPPVRRPLAAAVSSDPPQPKATSAPNPLLGVLRILVAFVRFWIGYLATVRPATWEGRAVVGDRWAYGYLVQPVSLRFAGPARLAEAVIRLLPIPDLVVNLAAPPEVIIDRKQELSEAEIAEELRAWESIPGPILTLDATRSPRALAAEVLEAIGR